MAKLQVSPELLLQALFGEFSPVPDIRLSGASYDFARHIVELEIKGPGVPDVEQVLATISFDFKSGMKTVRFNSPKVFDPIPATALHSG